MSFVWVVKVAVKLRTKSGHEGKIQVNFESVIWRSGETGGEKNGVSPAGEIW